MDSLFARWAILFGASLLGLIGGCALGNNAAQKDLPLEVQYNRLPHHVPQFKGGISFRFAMAHDVVHERFAKHGDDYYRHRNQRTREQLEKLPPDDEATFSLIDDLAVGLDRLGKADEAVELMQAKLQRQLDRNLEGRDLYTSYANLGTVLIHSCFPKAIAGNADARTAFREGVEFVRKSVEVNPEAHFGRERWQLAIGEFFLVVMDDPKLLMMYDCLGNRLDDSLANAYWEESRTHFLNTRLRPTNFDFREGGFRMSFENQAELNALPDDPDRWDQAEDLRSMITTIGAQRVSQPNKQAGTSWGLLDITSHQVPVPFDEPMLGIIGMWRRGGGANPHFALAIAETMWRVGQRAIAWTAYERAARMTDRFWPDPDLQAFLREHCRTRQRHIFESFSVLPSPSGKPPSEAEWRATFDKELAFGKNYQRSYQDYEQQRIVDGVPLSDPKFYDEFHTKHKTIATPTGSEEWHARVPGPERDSERLMRTLASGAFGAGLGALVAALLMRLWRRLR